MTAHDRFQVSAPPGVAEAVRPVAWVSVVTMSQLLDAGETTIWDWARKGIIPKPRKIGGLTRWKWSEVEKHIESGSTGSDDDDPILRASRGK